VKPAVVLITAEVRADAQVQRVYLGIDVQ